MKNIKITVLIIAIILLLSLFAFYFLNEQADPKMIMINHYKLSVELSKIPEEYERGLSGRKSMEENEGMLFLFPKEDYLPFWMPDMNFPIDIIWMNKECKVVYIAKNLPPCKNREKCPLITPDKLAQYVLEVVEGFSDKHQVQVGESLNICHL